MSEVLHALTWDRVLEWQTSLMLAQSKQPPQVLIVRTMLLSGLHLTA